MSNQASNLDDLQKSGDILIGNSGSLEFDISFRELQYASRDNITLKDIKNFVKSQIFQFLEQNKILINDQGPDKLLSLFFMSFISKIKQNQWIIALDRIKGFAYKNQIKVPQQYPESAIFWQGQGVENIRIIFAKLMMKIKSLQLKDLINLFNEYEIGLTTVNLILRNMLAKVQNRQVNYNEIRIADLKKLLQMIQIKYEDLLIIDEGNRYFQIKRNFHKQEVIKQVKLNDNQELGKQERIQSQKSQTNQKKQQNGNIQNQEIKNINKKQQNQNIQNAIQKQINPSNKKKTKQKKPDKEARCICQIM